MEKEKSCGCIVIDNNKVLLVKHNAGHWDFPKGHMENNEMEEETALREVKEETNLDVEIISGYRYTTEYCPKENVQKEVVYFLARKISSDIKAQESEISNIEWVEIEKATEQITYSNSKEILEKVKAEYKN